MEANLFNNEQPQAFSLPLTEDILHTIAQYRALAEASNTGAWEYHADSNTLECNNVYFSLLGRSIGDYDQEGRTSLQELWTDLLHPDDVADATERFGHYLSQPTGMYESVFRMRHADGNWVWICSRGRFLMDENGGYTNKIIGTHIDITAQKQAEEQIKSERLLLRTLIDSLPDTIYIKDADARKVIANKADLRVCGGKTEEEVIGKTDLEVFRNEIGERGYADDMELLRTGIPMLDKEEFFYDEYGQKNWLLTSKIPVRDESGRITRIIGIGRNITARKQGQDALNQANAELQQKSEALRKQTEDLKALNAQIIRQKEQELEKAIAQGKFEIASEVLHDIGNALVGFGSHLNRINRVLDRGNLDALKNLCTFLKSQQTAIAAAIGEDKAGAVIAIADGFIKTQTDSHKEISTAITELLHIISHIQEILNIQRQLVRGHGGLHERKQVNLVSIIEDCRAMLTASFEKRNIQLKMDIRPGSYVVKGDHTKLMQVMLNVLKNSIEAMPVELNDKRVQIFMESKNERILLRITDTGLGFDQETSDHLFERGFTTKESGTGLGLYNCRSIIESHAGTFEITSEGVGKGATTIILFTL